MFILAKLVFKSYMPKQLEKGMWFVSKQKDIVYGRVYEYLHLHELQSVPQDMDSYIAINGAPVEPYIVQPMMNADDPEDVLATPEQIGWWDEGDDSDDLEDLTVVILNRSIYGEDGEDGLIGLYVDDYTRRPILVQDKVVIRDSYAVDEEEDDEEDEYEEDWDDMDDLTHNEPDTDSAGFTIHDRYNPDDYETE